MTDPAATVAPDTDALVAARRSLHAVAECLLSGPQWRAVGRLRLRVVPGGFATVGGIALRVEGTVLVVDEGRRVPLVGTIGSVAAAAGLTPGAPEGVYGDHHDLAPDEPLALDPEATRVLLDWLVLGDAALRVLAPESEPALWPEHFDVAVEPAATTYGASPGDGSCVTPYAYISTATKDGDPFWNAPFGATLGAAEAPDLASLVAFWHRGQALLGDG